MDPAQLPAQPQPRATQVTIALNVAVFAVMVALGVSPSSPDTASLLRFGANDGVLVVLQHEWWRPLTSMFVHVGVLHLAVNMYSLWQIGGFVERLMGRTLYSVIYLLTGLAGAFASILWNPLSVSAGASGAIFGLFGVIVGFTIRARKELAPGAVASLRSGILSTIAINLVFALTSSFIDNAAHVGGMLSGTLAGFMATASSLEGAARRPQLRSQAIVLAVVVGLAILAVTRTRNNPDVRLSVALDEVQQATEGPAPDFAQVKRLSTTALAIKDDPRAHFLRAWAERGLGEAEAGLADLDAAVTGVERDERLRSLLPDVLLSRGQVRGFLGNEQGAEADLGRSLQLLDAPQTHAARAMLRTRAGRYADALADFKAALEKLPDDAGLKNDYAWALVQVGQELELALRLADEAVKKSPSAASLGTRCWVHAAREESDVALDDCRLAVEKGAGLLDQGMLAYLEGDASSARDAWESAAEAGPTEAAVVAPWLERAKALPRAGDPR